MACAQGALARLYVEPGISPHTFDASSEAYEFLSENVQKKGTVIHTNGIRGTRSAHSARSRLGPYTVEGSILFNPDPMMLDNWLPRILGEPEAGDVFAVAETLPAFGVLIDRVTQTFEYKDCYVNRAVFQGRSNQFGGEPSPLVMNLDIVGKSRVTGTAVPQAYIPVSTTTPGQKSNSPYIFEDGVLTMQAATRQIIDFTLLIDNNLLVRFTNSLTATTICPQSRTVAFRCTMPYSSDTPVTNMLDQSPFAAATLVFTNGTVSTSISLAQLQVETVDPVVRGKQEIVLEIAGIARMTSNPESSSDPLNFVREIIVTNEPVI